MKQPGRQFQTPRLARGAEVLRHAVSSKRLRINLLSVGYRLAPIVEHPIDAAALRVPELIDDIVVGPIRHLAIGRAVEPAGRRVSPEYPGVDDGRARRFFFHLQIAADRPIKAAVFAIHRVAHPKWQYVAE